MKNKSDRSKAQAKADKYFSIFIRQRDSENGLARCVTCGKVISDPDCGHFISRRFQATRYDEQNAHAQCKRCNRFQNGNQYEHGKAIDRMYGEGVADELLVKSRMIYKRTTADFLTIAELYKQKIKD